MEELFLPLAPGGLYESATDRFQFEDESSSTATSWMDMELDLSPGSPSLSLFQELEEVQEVAAAPLEQQTSRQLADLIQQFGIPVEEACPSSPTSSQDSDMESHQSLIEELEEFFGSPTTTEQEEGATAALEFVTTTSIPTSAASPRTILDAMVTTTTTMITEEDLQNAVTTSCVTEDGQNVIIIIAPSSPAPSTLSYSSDPPSDTDPDWAPSPSSALHTVSATSTTIRKKYQRTKAPNPPSVKYPKEKKERKKAQNRTAAFRYREKKKSELDLVEQEMELLQEKNVGLRDHLTEMETETKLLKKLMIQAGLGLYVNAIRH